MQADKLLAHGVFDVDGNVEERTGTICVFIGSAPSLFECYSPEDEINRVAEWINERSIDDIQPCEIGVFIRSKQVLD